MRISADLTSPFGRGGPGKMNKSLSDGVRDSLAVLQKQHKQFEIIKGGKGAPQAGKWTRRDGTLSKSFHISMQAGAMEGSYGSDLLRSRIIEEGGTIRAKNKPYLVFKTFDGTWHSRKEVTLPPRPTLDNAVKNSQADRDKIMQKALIEGVWDAL